MHCVLLLLQAEATNLTIAHNAALADLLSSFNSTMAGSMVYEFDIYSAFNTLLMNAQSVSCRTALFSMPKHLASQCHTNVIWYML